LSQTQVKTNLKHGLALKLTGTMETNPRLIVTNCMENIWYLA